MKQKSFHLEESNMEEGQGKHGQNRIYKLLENCGRFHQTVTPCLTCALCRRDISLGTRRHCKTGGLLSTSGQWKR